MAKLMEGDREVCNFGNGSPYYPSEGEEPNELDKSLISAAPELYEALGVMVAAYTSLVQSGDCGKWDGKADDCVVRAMAAIAKAEGGE